MNSSKDIGEAMHDANRECANAVENFISGMLERNEAHVYWLAVAAFHTGRARGMFRTLDLVETLEKRLSKREAKSTP